MDNDKRRISSALTKEKITEAFLQLYSVNSIEKITIKMLSDKAGINRSTFYSHYTDIYDLFHQLEDEFFEDLKAHIEPGIPRILKGENIFDIIPSVKFYEEYRLQFKIFIAEEGKSTLPKRIKELIRGIILNLMSKVTVEIKPEGYFILEYMMNAQLGAFAYWFNNSEKLSFDELKIVMEHSMSEGPLTYFKSIHDIKI